MEVKKDTIVEFTFSLVDDEGLPIESTPTNSTAILHGHGNVIRGVEKALEGKTAGEKFVVTVVPEDGYLSLIHI